MTTRDATPFLARLDRQYAGRPADLAMVIAFGALQWPWLARSLWGGRRRDKARLLERLGLSGDALPNLGSWKADAGFLRQIVDRIAERPVANVVELGSGASSLVIAQALAQHGGGRLTSYDQHADFIAATRLWLAEHGLAADFHAAPLVAPPAGWHGRWYDLTHLPAQIDLLVIDGPHWTLHPFVRGAAETLFDRIPAGGTVMLDDAARPGERIVAARWRRNWRDFDWRYVPGIKGTLVGTRR